MYKPNLPVACCVNLRCKSMYYRPDERPGRVHESDVMPHYCIRTFTLLGPDDREASPAACQPGRECYRAEE